MTIKEIQNSIVEEFKQFEDWGDKYAHLIKLGKQLELFPEELKTGKNKLDGCQSQVWMDAKLEDGEIIIKADSDAMIVKGLVAVLVKAYSNHTPEEILSSPPEFLTKIGIDKHLSPTRKNGLGAMLKQIQMYALAFKAMAAKS